MGIVQPNGLALSRAALLDRDVVVAGSDAQNGYDLVDAQRRRLERRVGWRGFDALWLRAELALIGRLLPLLRFGEDLLNYPRDR